MRRVPCSVSGCRRTMGADVYRRRFCHDPGAWICSAHWGRLTRAERRTWNRLKRLARRFGEEAIAVREDRVWAALLRRAALGN